jgi:predicted membrane protein
MSDDSRIEITPRLVIGICLALFGVLMFVDQLGFIDGYYLFRLWPVVLIVVGITMFAQRRHRPRFSNGIILICVGVWLLLNTLGIVHLQPWNFIWPIVLIFFGARLITRSVSEDRREDDRVVAEQRNASVKTDTLSSNAAFEGATAASSRNADIDTDQQASHLHIFAVLSGIKRRWGQSLSRRGSITVILAGCELDLRDVVFNSGEDVVIDITAVLGGVEIRVPPNCTLVSKVVPILGSVEDKTSSLSTAPASRLLLRGSLVLGSIEVSN